MRVLSGVQSSGTLHIGNYFGAIAQHIELQHAHECFFFIANYHALTSVQDAARLRQLTLDVALDYLALGLDPQKAALFRQSDVPEVCELAWVLCTVTGMGLLERGTSYRDKVENGLPASVGLFYYPVLMAADILIYNSDTVPVGKDQTQHIEFARDMAGYFNNTFGKPVFKLPTARLNEAAIVPGTDGRKMSKSYGNAIEIFGEPKAIARKYKSEFKTDSTPVEAPKDPDTCNLFAHLKLLAPPEELEDWRQRYRKGGVGYGHVKTRLVELYEARFGPFRERRAHLAAHPDEVEDILRAGAQRARAVAQRVMHDVRTACGIVTARS
ncbi:MAG: tryptophan--tRNA ligase [Planctomycetes bacterium]|nr:tryptophan--tRNA ligase [Planctomycetota bacterium]